MAVWTDFPLTENTQIDWDLLKQLSLATKERWRAFKPWMASYPQFTLKTQPTWEKDEFDAIITGASTREPNAPVDGEQWAVLSDTPPQAYGYVDYDDVVMQSTPPSNPSIFTIYIVAPGGSGEWVGHDNQIARWYNATAYREAGWEFSQPRAENYYYRDSNTGDCFYFTGERFFNAWIGQANTLATFDAAADRWMFEKPVDFFTVNACGVVYWFQDIHTYLDRNASKNYRGWMPVYPGVVISDAARLIYEGLASYSKDEGAWAQTKIKVGGQWVDKDLTTPPDYHITDHREKFIWGYSKPLGLWHDPVTYESCQVWEKDSRFAGGGDNPPASPVDGGDYVVGYSPTGAWADHRETIATYHAADDSWTFQLFYIWAQGDFFEAAGLDRRGLTRKYPREINTLDPFVYEWQEDWETDQYNNVTYWKDYQLLPVSPWQTDYTPKDQWVPQAGMKARAVWGRRFTQYFDAAAWGATIIHPPSTEPPEWINGPFEPGEERGEIYLIAAGATGDWTDHAGEFALYKKTAEQETVSCSYHYYSIQSDWAFKAADGETYCSDFGDWRQGLARVYEFDGEKWNMLNPADNPQPDIVETYGWPKELDYRGLWLFNDVQACLKLLTARVNYNRATCHPAIEGCDAEAWGGYGTGETLSLAKAAAELDWHKDTTQWWDDYAATLNIRASTNGSDDDYSASIGARNGKPRWSLHVPTDLAFTAHQLYHTRAQTGGAQPAPQPKNITTTEPAKTETAEYYFGQLLEGYDPANKPPWPSGIATTGWIIYPRNEEIDVILDFKVAGGFEYF